MSRYRKIDTRIWNDEKFCGLSDAGQLAFIFVLTHPSMTALGAMRATIPGLAAEKGWTTEAFAEAFGEALEKGMIEHEEKARCVALPNFLKYNPPESPNVVKAWAASLDLIPEGRLKTLTIQRAKGFLQGKTKAFAEALPVSFTEASPKPMPNQEQEPEQEPKPQPSVSGSGQESIALTHAHAREELHPDWSETDWALFRSTHAYQINAGDSELQAMTFATDKVERARKFRMERAA
ncbi:hypothetical protein [Kaistia defluvii]|uniref:Uncharacterized protein n=1 Tax=Kaistia defluvii TaxID=410841 RepID=A0ABV2R154_9HYPH